MIEQTEGMIRQIKGAAADPDPVAFISFGQKVALLDERLASVWLTELDVLPDPKSPWSGNRMGKKGVPALVVSLIEAFPTSRRVALGGCMSLYVLASSDEDLAVSNRRRQYVVDQGGLRALAGVLRAFALGPPKVGFAACKALYQVCGGEMQGSPRGNEARAIAAREGLVELVASYLEKHSFCCES